MGLSRDHWTEAGLAALAEGGVRAVAVEPLAKQLAATKGSFYWHFSNRDDLLQAVLDLWEDLETTQVIDALAALPDARAKLEALGRGAYMRASNGGAHAALLAAIDDPRVAPVVARITRARLGFLEELYRGLGMDGASATRYARLAHSVYLGAAALRRSDPDDHADGDEIDERVRLFVSTVIPPAVNPLTPEGVALV